MPASFHPAASSPPPRNDTVLPDDALLAGLGTGDGIASAAFIRRFQHRVYGIAFAVTGDSHLAEDVSQQAFERIWRHAHRYDASRGSVKAWVGSIARNTAIDATRARRPEPVDVDNFLSGLASTGTEVEQAALVHESTAELRTVLAQLPSGQARAVVMAAVIGLTAPEIAQAEHIPLGTAKSRIRVGMQRLRTVLGGDPAGTLGADRPAVDGDSGTSLPSREEERPDLAPAPRLRVGISRMRHGSGDDRPLSSPRTSISLCSVN
jgi:RNA polymerase sigma factor (sigma-70 family)